eukprot:6175677-Pleurochrysis_carterae.AAC.4
MLSRIIATDAAIHDAAYISSDHADNTRARIPPSRQRLPRAHANEFRNRGCASGRDTTGACLLEGVFRDSLWTAVAHDAFIPTLRPCKHTTQ